MGIASLHPSYALSVAASEWIVGSESTMRKFAIIVLILIAIPVVWFWASFPTASYRYRLTIAVEVDGQVYSDSSVIEVWYRFNPQWLWQLFNVYNMRLQGQAVLIDLGTRGTLVASLGKFTDPSSVEAQDLAGRAYLSFPRRDTSGFAVTLDNVRAISQMHDAMDLTPDDLPLFLWFSDIANPATARVVKPADFSTVIGDETRLARAQVEITHDPIVVDVDKRLPWYNTLKAKNDVLKVDGLLLGAGSFVGSGFEK